MISTEGGQSGSPIIVIDSTGSYKIVGIHKGGIKIKEGDKDVLANVGKLID